MISPAQWLLARNVFDRAIECEPAARASFIEQECSDDSTLLTEVMSLLDSWNQANSVFDNPLFDIGAAADRFEGKLAGPYRILRRLGHGGMGAVYLAERADDQFRRQVALKLLRPGFDDGQLVRRFRNEMQLLAVLDHPHIVKLHDAGMTSEEIPYFVMDYIVGQPLDRYCESRKLAITQRLSLFRDICGAVHYAHRNLVVHRDLKPANILVTPEGTIKLLDFGIAKLLRPEYAAGAIGLTRTMQPMTPEYASPEQLQGQPVTTSSDVYSLGVILYYLVAGKHPYGNTRSALELERAVCETEPQRPSSVADSEPARRRSIDGDLDNITLMAMRKEPQRRYASAEHLSEDIRRYLQALPVTARADSLLYRANRFTARHRAGVAAGTLAIIGLLASSAIAWVEKGRAEKRFEDFRNANAFMLFDLNQVFRKDVTAGLKRLMEEGVKNFDQMAKESGNDAGLKLEASDGYHRLGDIQGNPLKQNLGDTAGARTSYAKALEMAEAAYRIKASPEARASIGSANLSLGELAAFSGSRAEAETRLRTAIHDFEAWAAVEPARSRQDKAKQNTMVAWEQLGGLHDREGDLPAATKDYSRSLAMARELAASTPGPGAQKEVMKEAILTGFTLAKSGLTGQALDALHEALPIATSLADGNPEGRRDQGAVHEYLGYVLGRAGRSEEAIGEYRQSIGIFGILASEDVSDRRARMDLGQAWGETSDVLWRAKRTAEAREAAGHALEILKPLVEQKRPLAEVLRIYAHALLAPQNGTRRDSLALQYAVRADELTSHTDPETLETLAQAYAMNGDTVRSRQSAERGLAILPAGGDLVLRQELERWLSGSSTAAQHESH